MAKINRNKNFDFLSNEEIIKLATPQNEVESQFLDDALKKLGDNTSVLKLANYLNVGKTTIYRAIENKKLVAFKVGSRNIIMTKCILNLVEIES